MRASMLVSWCAILLSSLGWASDARPTISNGIITYTPENGEQRTIDVGKKCADLWVSPDESVITFIAIDRARTPSPSEQSKNEEAEVLIEQSSIYIARRSERFAPTLLVSRPFVIDGRSWSVVRTPRLSPDQKTLFFTIPYTMTTSRLMSLALPAGTYQSIGDETNYCVVWGGKKSGYLLMQRRYLSTKVHEGISYPCYARDPAGLLTKVSDECWPFGDFADRWSREQRATCQ